MAFDIQYVGDLTQKFLALEPEYQQLRGERNFYLRQIADHAGFLGNVSSIDEKTAAIIIEFIRVFLKSNPAYNSGGLMAIDFTPRPQPSHFGGVRDDD
jgi:hypothetical protein